MKKILSLILSVCMVVSAAAVCTISSGAALDPASYPNVKIFAGLTQDQVAVGQGYAGGRASTVSVTAQSTHYDIKTSSDTATDEHVYVKLPALVPGTTYKYMAYKYKLTSGANTFNPWLYVDGTFADGSSMNAGAVNSGWRVNPHATGSSTGTGKWTTVIIALPDGLSQYSGGGTFDMTATVDSIRFGTPTTSASTLSFAWTGLFASEADVAAFDAAFNAQYTLTDDAVVSTKTEVFPATQNIANASLTDGSTTYTVPHKITFDDADYVAWVGKNASAEGSPLRKTWTSRQANDSAKFVTDSDGNTYFNVTSFYTAYSDFRFANGNAFLYSADVRYTGDATNFRAFIVNFGNEKTAANKGNVFYENNGINADGAHSFTGYSGCGIYLTKTNAVNLFVYTVDDSGKLGVVEGEVAINATTSNWNTLKIYDDGSSTISFYMGDEYIGKIVYSNAGLLPLEVTDYNERYYRTADIYGKDGTKLAGTTKAVISYTKSFGMGTRATTMDVDNLQIAKYTAPAEKVSVSLGSVSGTVGSTVTVPVTLNTATAQIAAVETIVEFDATKLAFAGFEWGDAFTAPAADSAYAALDLGAKETTTGTIDILMINVGTNGFENTAATGVLVKLKFTILEAATVGEEIALSFASPEGGNDITGYNDNYDTVDFSPVYTAGKVTVEAAAAPTTPTTIELNSDSAYYVHKNGAMVAYQATVAKSGIKTSVFLSNFVQNNVDGVSYLQVVDGTGNVVAATAIIKTGYKLQLVDAKGTVVKGSDGNNVEYAIAVLGDVNCDGKVRAADASAVVSDISSGASTSYGTAIFAAADVNNDGKLRAKDGSLLTAAVANGQF